MKKFFSSLLVLMLSTSVFAASRTFYFQATAETVVPEMGDVYASFDNVAPTEEQYADSVTTEVFNKSAGNWLSTPSNTTTTLRLYAQEAEGYRFVGWTTDTTTNAIVSTNKVYAPTVTSANYGDASNPAQFHYFAIFMDANVVFSSAIYVSTVGAAGLISVADTANSQVFAAAMADSILGVESALHTYYLKAQGNAKARFAGWYSDEACEHRISTNANYTYTVTAESMDAANPTEFNVYAKFDSIHYFSSKLTATVDGEGLVAVTLTSNGTKEFGAQAEVANLEVIDATIHNYYLTAKSNDANYVDFYGWYSEEGQLLSTNTTYTYKASALSEDSLAPTLSHVEARFVERNPYQMRNASFEVWNDAHNDLLGWHGPATATGSFAGFVGGPAPKPEPAPGRTGDYACRLTSKNATVLVVTVKTNGNLTTGIMNAGSTSATDEANHNHTVANDPAHSLRIIGQPDSMEIYSKFKRGQEGDYSARATLYMHDSINNFQDPTVARQAYAQMSVVRVDLEESEDWERHVAALEYSEDWDFDRVDSSTVFVLCDITTNPNPGESIKDTLDVDDIRLIYNSELLSAKYGEDTVVFVDGANTEFSTVNYDESLVALESNGRGAKVEKEYDNASGVLTITVKGQDIDWNEENVHVYTMQFVGISTGIQSAEVVRAQRLIRNGMVCIRRGNKFYNLQGVQIK